MKTHTKGLLALALCLNLTMVDAQPARPGGMGGGPRSSGPHISAAMAKLFGDHQTFTADVENEVSMGEGKTMSLPGKLAFDSGKARFEMNMAEAKGNALPPEAVAQMKSMGMDKMISISRPDQKANYLVYPSLKAYATMPNDQEDSTSEADYKIETTELGKETIDGHPCVKNKAVVTDPDGKKHESTLWNATDLKKFPVQIKTSENGNDITIHFKNVKMSKPDSSEFNPPADFKKYDNMMSLMQAEMMKRMQQNGMPAGHP